MGFIVIGVTWQISSSLAPWPVPPMPAAVFKVGRAEGSPDQFAPRKLNTIRETAEQMQSFQYSAGGEQWLQSNVPYCQIKKDYDDVVSPIYIRNPQVYRVTQYG